MLIKCTLLMLSLAGGYQVAAASEESAFTYRNITKGAFVRIGRGYYYIETRTKANLIDAAESCQRKGAHLIVFETLEEWDLVNQYLFKNDIDDLYWTLAADLAQEGIFGWPSAGRSVKLDTFNQVEHKTHNRNEFCERDDAANYTLSELDVNEKKCEYECLYICEKSYPILESFFI